MVAAAAQQEAPVDAAGAHVPQEPSRRPIEELCVAGETGGRHWGELHKQTVIFCSRKRRRRCSRWALLCVPELSLIVVYAALAIALAATVPYSHVFFHALAGMATPFGVIFGIGAPLLLFHILRLGVVLVTWGVRALWRSVRLHRFEDEQLRHPWSSGEEPTSQISRGMKNAHEEMPRSQRSSDSSRGTDRILSRIPRLSAWQRLTQLGHRTNPQCSRSQTYAACDFFCALFLYLLLGLTASFAWARCPAPSSVPGAPTDIDHAPILGEMAPNNSMLAAELSFPPSFKFGAASSAYQVEGGLVNSSWHAFERALPPYEHKEGTETVRDYAGKAANVWNLFDEDLDRIKWLGLQTYRISLSWSRLHRARGEFDMSVLTRYRRWLNNLRTAGIEPMVTLHHYEEPIWVSMQGSWVNDSTIDDWLEFVNFVAEELGDKVDLWITQNEPFVYAGLGWMEGRWPPGLLIAIREWWAVMVHLSVAHRRAYTMLHQVDQIDADGDNITALVSIAKNLNLATPARLWSVIDPLVAGAGTWGLVNLLYLELIDAHHFLDYLGINHYFDLKVRGTQHSFTVPETSLYQIVCEASAWFPEVAIAVTEHGYWTPNFPGVEDTDRQRYIFASLRHLMTAIDQEVSIMAYQYWALLDSFEWEGGFLPRFGLFAVNFTDPGRRRIERDFAGLYRIVAKRHAHRIAHATRTIGSAWR